jgi:2-haloalkanoic acid dehalogenase type II
VHQDDARPRTQGWRAILLDLLMAVMDSPAVWESAAPGRGTAWRDAVTLRMIDSVEYLSYEALVAEAARDLNLPPDASTTLFSAWPAMTPRADAAAIATLDVPYAFVTNTSRRLAETAAGRSGLRPAFTLSAEEAGCYKPDPRIYRAACDRLGFDAAQVLFVAGAPYDAAGARRAGLDAAWVRRRADHHPPPGVRVIGALGAITAGGQP